MYSGQNGSRDEIADEFDRTLQITVWDQARHALQEVTDLESYRVVCSELIFGLVQKPWDPDARSTEQKLQDRMHKYGHSSTIPSAISLVREIVIEEQRPQYIESAARKMHLLKYRSEAMGNGLGSQNGAQRKGSYSSPSISPEDRAKIGLLYWLTIVFDTISSSMNERPVVVFDEDCEHEEQNIRSAPVKVLLTSLTYKMPFGRKLTGSKSKTLFATRSPCISIGTERTVPFLGN